MAQTVKIHLQCRRPGFNSCGLGRSPGEGNDNKFLLSLSLNNMCMDLKGYIMIQIHVLPESYRAVTSLSQILLKSIKFPEFYLENPMDKRSLMGYSPWGSQRVKHDWATNTTPKWITSEGKFEKGTVGTNKTLVWPMKPGSSGWIEDQTWGLSQGSHGALWEGGDRNHPGLLEDWT